MHEPKSQMDMVVWALQERAKELNCLYRIEELLNNQSLSHEETFNGIAEAIPPGWQYPDYCNARIEFNDEVFTSGNFYETQWVQKAEIVVQDMPMGMISVYYTEEMPTADEGPFLKEERKLINTIADRIAHYALHVQMKKVYEQIRTKEANGTSFAKPEWSVVLDLLKKTDRPLFSIISRKMINHMFCKGIKESQDLFRKLGALPEDEATLTEINRPSKKKVLENSFNLGDEIYNVASKYFTDEQILQDIQKWIYEEKSHYLIKALANPHTPLSEIADAIRRYYHINPDEDRSGSPVGKGIRVSLVRRFLTDQLDFINIAKNYCDVSDFYELLQNMIFPADSSGKLGGKGAGLFLAKKIIQHSPESEDILNDIKTPKTWYITSDGILNFVYYNNLEEVIEQKYKPVEEIRQEYPHIIQAFKNSNFSPEIRNGLSRALDDFGENPIIVRSSSLLEDRIGSAFAGKYKSLFLANQGTKQERMDALMDAIAEVYASTFGPDPIGYRSERGLLDFDEEMGILIQEVVGTKIGKYFFPAMAGVAFSNNEFRWSSRIKRNDGLIRMVPGLGTRAVDRIGSDYPILIAPGKPELRVNLSVQERIGYSPKNMDVINLETNTFETVSIRILLKEVGNAFPAMNDIFSIVEHNHLKAPVGLGIDINKHEISVTFENLLNKGLVTKKIHSILQLLRSNLRSPVDIEFAYDGINLYLLQCRPQSSSQETAPAIIPKDINPEKIIFTADRYVSNGIIPDINFIIYIDPAKYSETEELYELKQIGNAVGKLNKLLPKKRFILMGPGRWGSRDDIRLGVRVSYSDINNTAVLIEIARKKGNYTPDLSFGTHFFQDLVEAGIRYLPLYPDDEKVRFNERFFENNENVLAQFLPEYEHLSDTIKVINVSEVTNGQTLRILMNADEDEAMGFISDRKSRPAYKSEQAAASPIHGVHEALSWRKGIAEHLAASIDPDRFGVQSIYLFGTVYNNTAGANSDIDLLFICNKNSNTKKELRIWLEGWNKALIKINFNKYGIKIDRVIDPHIVGQEELDLKPYFQEIIDPKRKKAKKLL